MEFFYIRKISIFFTINFFIRWWIIFLFLFWYYYNILFDCTFFIFLHDKCSIIIVMDRTRAKQGKEAWLQPIGEIQDKTKQDRAILED
jgi:hypothetical protein